MPEPKLDAGAVKALDQVLGYLNYSSGAEDAQTLRSLNALSRQLQGDTEPFHAQLCCQLRQRLRSLSETSQAFQDAGQAEAVISLLWDACFPRYREFHQDLLGHHEDDALFRPFFIGRFMESVLQQGGPWDETERIVEGASARLNDFIGFRPVPTLEQQRCEPYKHEWVRPIPLYIREAGVEFSEYETVLQLALEILGDTSPDLLQIACFDLEMADEIAVDPRAYDFDHPANKRPNYHFGMWDPHCIDNNGRYRRYVVQPVTLDALMARLTEDFAPAAELRFEAAAVLAGTVLMSTAVCGRGPNAFASTVSLGHLLRPIAAMRDEFYARLLEKLDGPHRQRLELEAAEFQQPFGSARQHLNGQLAKARATQLEHVHLARLYARMGFLEASVRQARSVPVASARMHCDLDCMATTANRLLDAGRLEEAVEHPQKILALLQRGIECGAIVDPWNILGFDAHFSLFHAMENSIHDHRIDDLIGLVERLWALYSRIWADAAAVDAHDVCDRVEREFQAFTDWWRQFAAHEVESVDCADPYDVYNSAKHVAKALNLWHQGGAETGDIQFWAPHAELFDSPKGYSLVIDALLQRGDFVTSMALLNHWLCQADRIPLEQGECSFHELTEIWIEHLLRSDNPDVVENRWSMVKRFFDHLEANADEYWSAPGFELDARNRRPAEADDLQDLLESGDEQEEEEENLFGAAYEDFVFRDSADDGGESSLDEIGDDDDEFSREAIRLSRRLAFLGNLARLWKNVAVRDAWESSSEDIGETMLRWVNQALRNRLELLSLLDDVRCFAITISQMHHEAMLDYDRRRLTKESLLDRIIATCVETLDAARMLAAAAIDVEKEEVPEFDDLNGEMQHAVRICSAVFRRRTDVIRREIPKLSDTLSSRPLLYVPLSKGGDPRLIVAARMRQQTIYDLLVWLPRCGLLSETCQLMDTARRMERDVSVGSGAVTEFDELFAAGYRALVIELIHCEFPADSDPNAGQIELLERLTESLLVCWLAHSRTLRLSVLEKVSSTRSWERLVDFIQRYGGELFTQRFLNLGNIRAILHQGVAEWIEQLQEFGSDEPPTVLLDDLQEERISLQQVEDSLTLILEAIIENYGEYRDYNSTTTQSDRGEMLYSLLDFLRLRTRYDRIAWNLRPVIWAHDVLIRHNCKEVAATWRQALTERVREEADLHMERLAELQKKYAMKMPTVADRLSERFVKPLQIDSMRALVPAAIDEARRQRRENPDRSSSADCPSFDRLEKETTALASDPAGVGLDAPPWLFALEEEVESATRPTQLAAEDIAQHAGFERVTLSAEEARQQLENACDWENLARLIGGVVNTNETAEAIHLEDVYEDDSDFENESDE